MRFTFTAIMAIALFAQACMTEPAVSETKGKLYIIGGGSRPAAMIEEMATLSGATEEGYGFILPMSSADPDGAIARGIREFTAAGVLHVTGYNFSNEGEIPATLIDSLRNARLIYIPGGVQSRFMNAINGTGVAEAIHDAYRNGALIAGTSAGAAVMSRKMITGSQLNPREGSGYVTIAEGNLEIIEGLGLLDDVIVDQHFIMRERLNRLVSAAIDHPEQLCIGIDESTAIIVDGNMATVTGESQVIVISNAGRDKRVSEDGLLGAEGMELSVYFPGESFRIR